jgi:catechol 2,3-dioxygenase-like lactoylglutathione lyase family enzyme
MQRKDLHPVTDGIAYISIGVADLKPVTDFWIDQLGLEVVARRTGPDPELGRLWNLPGEQFIDQLLLATPGAATGQLHFVQFRQPGQPVRAGAAVTDLGAKNLDVNCTDMPARIAALADAGCVFRSAISEYAIGDIQAREVQMPGHDALNIVFIEVLSEGFEVSYSPRGFAAVTSFVVIVQDTRAEARFYRDVFGWEEIMHHRITGPGIEKVVGLPPGAALDMRLVGPPDNLFGRMELITYEGLSGADRFRLAVPPATGILGCGLRVRSIAEIAARAAQHGIDASPLLNVDSLPGRGRCAVLYSPAGLRVELLEGC